jgi:FkbM family methyltransferase
MSLFSSEDVVEALYSGVLGRRADPAGLLNWVNLLNAEPERLQEVAQHFFKSVEHQEIFNENVEITDCSQFGEYRIIRTHLTYHPSKYDIIVDVGARGIKGSNSFDLLKKHGWRGVLVEANPGLWDSIEEEFAGLSFKLIRCAVSDSPGKLPFYLGVDDSVSSLDAEQAESWGPVRGVVEVDVRKLGDILLEESIPHDFDVLSLDIEGYDVRVFNDLIAETNYRPAVVIIETSMGFFNRSMNDVPFNDTVRAAYNLSYQTIPNMILTVKQ